MEKQLATVAYWLGILCTVIALITRGLALVGVFAFTSTAVAGRNPISYRTFLEGAVLFFVMAIASAVIALAKEKKA
ncbi:MAG: hypothetical protein ACLPZY_21300 [Terracidiphilus sp.]